MFLVSITHHSKIRELSDGNKNWKQCQTDFSAVGPTYFELWVMETLKPNSLGSVWFFFFFLHHSSLNNQRIEGWKQKLETKSKWTFQPWVSPFLSYELWKQQIQTAL